MMPGGILGRVYVRNIGPRMATAVAVAALDQRSRAREVSPT